MPLSEELQKRLSKIDRSTFRHAAGFRTAALFRDHPSKAHDPEYCLFYMGREFSDDQYIALKEVYMQIADPTEYQFAMAVFGSMRHWNEISDLVWTRDRVAEWRKELEIKLRSEAIMGIIDLVDDPETKETTKFQSLKWLAQSEFAEKETASTKKKKIKEAKVKDAVVDTISSDFERLGISPRSIN